jgi:hypothetical protein
VIRRAEARDQSSIEAIVRAAYSIYTARIGQMRGPMARRLRAAHRGRRGQRAGG